jgi:hypothetical protein
MFRNHRDGVWKQGPAPIKQMRLRILSSLLGGYYPYPTYSTFSSMVCAPAASFVRYEMTPVSTLRHTLRYGWWSSFSRDEPVVLAAFTQEQILWREPYNCECFQTKITRKESLLQSSLLSAPCRLIQLYCVCQLSWQLRRAASACSGETAKSVRFCVIYEENFW